MTSRLQVPFWELVWVRSLNIVPNREKMGQNSFSVLVVPRQGGFLDCFSKARLFESNGFLGLARVTSHFRSSCSVASQLRFRPLRRCRRGGFLLGCFTASSAKQRQGILGTEGEPANGLFSGGTQSDVDAAVAGHADGQ